ncbi:cytochrome P450 89A2-like, partial [Asparagus officinalis]|uniref:cytochrome P450 89A2-like n=1 Tax=Asparagus officinalis TaxID=4686 RepID=UPI00098E4386
SRDWVLNVLTDHLHSQLQSSSNSVVVPVNSLQFAMFCLLVLMCFGEKLDERAIREIESALRNLLLYSNSLNVLNFFPSVSKYLFRNRRRIALEMLKKQTEVCVPLINARREHKKNQRETEERYVYSYLDSLLDIRLAKIRYVILAHNADAQWRRHSSHPPGHFVLPHAMSEEVEFEGYTIPKNATVNFMVAEMQLDEKVWKDPMEFRPERFIDDDGGLERVDITGSKEIKMMPFGVGRRICPGLQLAMLHLEYFVANLVMEFEWRGVDGEKVDFSEKPQFTVVMKHPLRARLVPRRKR